MHSLHYSEKNTTSIQYWLGKGSEKQTGKSLVFFQKTLGPWVLGFWELLVRQPLPKENRQQKKLGDLSQMWVGGGADSPKRNTPA